MKYIKRIIFIVGALLAAIFLGKTTMHKALKKTINVDLNHTDEKAIIAASEKQINQLNKDNKEALDRIDSNIKENRNIKKKLQDELKKVEANESAEELNTWLNRPE